MLSVNNWRINRPRPAPTAMRTAISRSLLPDASREQQTSQIPTGDSENQQRQGGHQSGNRIDVVALLRSRSAPATDQRGLGRSLQAHRECSPFPRSLWVLPVQLCRERPELFLCPNLADWAASGPTSPRHCSPRRSQLAGDCLRRSKAVALEAPTSPAGRSRLSPVNAGEATPITVAGLLFSRSVFPMTNGSPPKWRSQNPCPRTTTGCASDASSRAGIRKFQPCRGP